MLVLILTLINIMSLNVCSGHQLSTDFLEVISVCSSDGVILFNSCIVLFLKASRGMGHFLRATLTFNVHILSGPFHFCQRLLLGRVYIRAS